MQVVTESEIRLEIQRIDSLIGHLETLHNEAGGLVDDDLKGSVLASLDDAIDALRDEHRKMQLELGSLGLPLP
jgi:hypothetical protein